MKVFNWVKILFSLLFSNLVIGFIVFLIKGNVYGFNKTYFFDTVFGLGASLTVMSPFFFFLSAFVFCMLRWEVLQDWFNGLYEYSNEALTYLSETKKLSWLPVLITVFILNAIFLCVSFLVIAFLTGIIQLFRDSSFLFRFLILLGALGS